MRYQKLFSDFKMKGMTMRNRVILPAMGTKMATIEGHVTDQLISYHAARAKGGCGLNMVEVCAVHGPSAPVKFLALYKDTQISGHRQLTDAIHAEGGKAGLQLWQGGLAASIDRNAQIILPSEVTFAPGYTIPAADTETIEQVIACFGKAAERAVSAGYDCVEFHCAHNYMPHAFLSGGFNHRTDCYGGSFENRARFPLACIRAIKENIPDEMPLFMRIDAHDDYLPEGLTIEEVIAFCKLAKEAGVDVLDVSRGNIVTPASVYEVPPLDIPRGFNVDNAARIRQETGMVTACVGRINTPDLAEKILSDDKADLIVMGRAQIADPNFCNKAKAGRPEEIVYCVGCNQGCYDGFCDPGRPFITCLRNPVVGREQEMALQKAETPKRVLIAGGGVAGLQAAIVLYQRGHMPMLYEESDKLGGQFWTAGTAPRKQEMQDAAESMIAMVERYGIPVKRNTRVTAELIENIRPDAVILSIGAQPAIPSIPGINGVNVVDSHAVLDSGKIFSGKVTVIGGGLVGLEVAEFLADKGCSVTVVEALPDVGSDLGSLRKICVSQSLQEYGIQTVTGAKCIRILPDGLIVDKNGTEEKISSDHVIVAVGAKSRDSRTLEDACNKLRIPYYIIGDAKKPRRALDAIAEASITAREI